MASLAHSELQPVLGLEDVRVKLESEERVIRMELPPGVFDARHGDNTDVLLALLTQNKELEGRNSVQASWVATEASTILLSQYPTTTTRPI